MMEDSSTAIDAESTGMDWSNSSSGDYLSSTGVVIDLFGSSAPAGFVAYGVVCFIMVVVFTAVLVVYYARPKLPPFVGVLTFLAWSHTQADTRTHREGTGRR